MTRINNIRTPFLNIDINKFNNTNGVFLQNFFHCPFARSQNRPLGFKDEKLRVGLNESNVYSMKNYQIYLMAIVYGI